MEELELWEESEEEELEELKLDELLELVADCSVELLELLVSEARVELLLEDEDEWPSELDELDRETAVELELLEPLEKLEGSFVELLLELELELALLLELVTDCAVEELELELELVTESRVELLEELPVEEELLVTDWKVELELVKLWAVEEELLEVSETRVLLLELELLEELLELCELAEAELELEPTK